MLVQHQVFWSPDASLKLSENKGKNIYLNLFKDILVSFYVPLELLSLVDSYFQVSWIY